MRTPDSPNTRSLPFWSPLKPVVPSGISVAKRGLTVPNSSHLRWRSGQKAWFFYLFRTLNDVRRIRERWQTEYSNACPHESQNNLTPLRDKNNKMTLIYIFNIHINSRSSFLKLIPCSDRSIFTIIDTSLSLNVSQCIFYCTVFVNYL